MLVLVELKWPETGHYHKLASALSHFQHSYYFLRLFLVGNFLPDNVKKPGVPGPPLGRKHLSSPMSPGGGTGC